MKYPKSFASKVHIVDQSRNIRSSQSLSKQRKIRAKIPEAGRLLATNKQPATSHEQFEIVYLNNMIKLSNTKVSRNSSLSKKGHPKEAERLSNRHVA